MNARPTLPQRDAELSRLATFAAVTADRYAAVYARVAEVQFGRDDADTVGLALDVLAILDGPNPRQRASAVEAYDGELAMLRGLASTLCLAARKGDVLAVQQALFHFVVDDENARVAGSLAGADFFQPGRAYRSRRCADLRFECLALSVDPDGGDRRAIGWRFGPPCEGARPHQLAALGVEDFACCAWVEDTEAGEGR